MTFEIHPVPIIIMIGISFIYLQILFGGIKLPEFKKKPKNKK